MQGDVVSEDVPVLYFAYVNGEGEWAYEHPSVDSQEVEACYFFDRLEVIGEQGDWLAVKMRTKRSYGLRNGQREVREQLERLYVQRQAVWPRDELLLSAADLQKPVLAYCLEGQRNKKPREVRADSLLRMELISEEEFLQARERRAVMGDLPWYPGVLRMEDQVLVPMDTAGYLLVYSSTGELADEQETERTRAVVDSLERIPNALERATSWMSGEELREGASAGGGSGDVEGEDDEDRGGGMLTSCAYVGELPRAGIAVFNVVQEQWSDLLFLRRPDGEVLFYLVENAAGLPYISPDSTYMVGIGSRWYGAEGVVLTFVHLSEDGGQVATELLFPYMQFLFMDEREVIVFVADGSVYARVFSRRAGGSHPMDFAQYVRISPRAGWL